MARPKKVVTKETSSDSGITNPQTHEEVVRYPVGAVQHGKVDAQRSLGFAVSRELTPEELKDFSCEFVSNNGQANLYRFV